MSALPCSDLEALTNVHSEIPKTISGSRASQIDRDRLKAKVERGTLREWSPYDIDLVNGNQSEEHTFFQNLDKAARFPRLAVDRISNLNTSRHFKKHETLEYMLEATAGNEDLITLHSEEELELVLEKDFDVPILSQTWEQNYPQAFSSSNFLKHVEGTISQAEQTPTISVYDYTKKRLEDRTTTVSLTQVLDTFTYGNGGRNFLDIENRTGIQFAPKAVLKIDLYNLMCSAEGDDAGKTNSTWEQSKVLEFFLASEAKALSTTHVDNGGTATWLKLIRGRKIWYFARDHPAPPVKALASSPAMNVQVEGFDWVKVELKAGDLLYDDTPCYMPR
jgi:hypothetical protein